MEAPLSPKIINWYRFIDNSCKRKKSYKIMYRKILGLNSRKYKEIKIIWLNLKNKRFIRKSLKKLNLNDLSKSLEI